MALSIGVAGASAPASGAAARAETSAAVAARYPRRARTSIPARLTLTVSLRYRPSRAVLVE